MIDSSEQQPWHWISLEHRQASGSQAELLAQLKSQKLPPSTLVWRVTWLEWLPASRVSELASVLPPHTQLPAREPRRDPSAREPPPVRRPTASTAEAARGPSAAPVTALPGRPTAAALAISTEPSVPPREALRAWTAESSRQRPAALLADPAPNWQVSSVAEHTPTPPALTPSRTELRREPQGARTQLSGEGALVPPDRSRPLTRLPVLTLALGALSAALAGALIAVLSAGNSQPMSGSSARSLEPRVRVLGCALLHPAARLAASVARGVQPHVSALSDGRVALGFAATPTIARGLLVDAATLDVTAVHEDAGEGSLLAVVPSFAPELRFRNRRVGDALEAPRALDGTSDVELGFTSAGLVKRVAAGEPELLWPGAFQHSTAPRAARATSAGYGLIFRRGGQSGSLWLGWLDRAVRARGRLTELPTGTRFVGTPVAAGNAFGLLIAFAGRAYDNEPYQLHVARAPYGGAPEPIQHVRTPEASLERGAIAPALASFGPEEWVLQWTEGDAGRYQVRVQRLDAQLAPVGAALVVSPKGASAGQGGLAVQGQRVVSYFVLNVGGKDELWGATLECR